MDGLQEHTRPFPAFLQDLKKGEVAEELTAEMAKVVSAVETIGASASLTLKITVAPNRGVGVLVTEDISIKLPKVGRGASVFFPYKGGLINEDPKQMTMDDFLSKADPAEEDPAADTVEGGHHG